MAFGALRFDDLLAVSLSGQVLHRSWLDPIAARLIDHVGHCTRDLYIAKLRVAAVRGHVAYAIESMKCEAGETLRGTTAPSVPVTDLRRPVDTLRVAFGALRLDDLFAISLCGLRRRQRQRHKQREEKICRPALIRPEDSWLTFDSRVLYHAVTPYYPMRLPDEPFTSVTPLTRLIKHRSFPPQILNS